MSLAKPYLLSFMLSFFHEVYKTILQVDEPEPEIVSNEPLPTPERLPGADAYSDVAYLYTSFLWGYPESIWA